MSGTLAAPMEGKKKKRETSTGDGPDALCYANFTPSNDFQDPKGNRKPFD